MPKRKRRKKRKINIKRTIIGVIIFLVASVFVYNLIDLVSAGLKPLTAVIVFGGVLILLWILDLISGRRILGILTGKC